MNTHPNPERTQRIEPISGMEQSLRDELALVRGWLRASELLVMGQKMEIDRLRAEVERLQAR